MSAGRNGGLDQELPSLNGSLAEGEASLDLNAAGILLEQTRANAELYLQEEDWNRVEEVGGERYARCEGCGRELLTSLGGAAKIPPADGCPNA